jgi:hypothetical protein
MGYICNSAMRHKCLTQSLPPHPPSPTDALNNAKSVLSSADLLKKKDQTILKYCSYSLEDRSIKTQSKTQQATSCQLLLKTSWAPST